MISNTLKIGACLIVSAAFLSFLTDEYHNWDQRLVCDSKCIALGCKGGTLMHSESQQTATCKCLSDNDFLIVLNGKY
ncbi:hypothetical protein PALB_18210 [Pseudoalteromonas luteoviolacea B = ATCC 29581]|nr:hypothetical protein PALB_18210 [Pseudoalteromonas luteoviolacea B = ATCC 29581]